MHSTSPALAVATAALAIRNDRLARQNARPVPRPKWVWARRETRWDVYPQAQPRVLLRLEPVGPHFVRLFHPEGHETIEGYEIQCDATADELTFAGVTT